MKLRSSRTLRAFRFLHRSDRPATESQLREALWDLVASVHMNPHAAEDGGIRLACGKAVRLLERGKRGGRA